MGCHRGTWRAETDFSFPTHPRTLPALQAGGQAEDRETVLRDHWAPSLPPHTLLCLMTKTRAARSCQAEEALAHTWTSVAQLAQDYPCREACTSDSRLQLGVPIFCALLYMSVSPK